MPPPEHAPRQASAMAKRIPKYARVAAAVQGLIADGTLRPGQPAPSGAALSRVTGYSTLTCRRALRVLIADGVLTPGPSRNARPRVAGPPQQQAARDLAAASRALSAGLATRRRSYGLTQPELALLLDVSVTTIGHAETGRLWQSRQFWEHADAILSADGDLLRLHDAFGEAHAATAADAPAAAETTSGGETASAGETGQTASAGETLSTGEAGSADETAGAAAPGQPAEARTAAPEAGPVPGDSPQASGPVSQASGPVSAAPPAGQPTEPAVDLMELPPAARVQSRPAYVMIMWGDGTMTTVHPPETPFPGSSLAATPLPDETPPR
jgi:DNA-binding GntR family transcriptional regulator